MDLQVGEKVIFFRGRRNDYREAVVDRVTRKGGSCQYWVMGSQFNKEGKEIGSGYGGSWIRAATPELLSELAQAAEERALEQKQRGLANQIANSHGLYRLPIEKLEEILLIIESYKK